jgi:uncharacterized protein (TIGR00369 family)
LRRGGHRAFVETLDSIDSYSELLGIEEFKITDWGVEVRLPTAKRHANMGGWVHGGVVAGLLDFALGAAVVATLEEGEWCATQSLTTDFLRPGKPGETLLARGRVDRRGKLAAFPSGEVLNEEGELLARATGVWAVRK